MSRHLVRSFILAAVLSPLVDAGPCKAPELSSTIESFTAILESSTELPTTTTEAIILTTTEAAETTTAAVPCIDNKFSPPPRVWSAARRELSWEGPMAI
ncbi:unnamed protein product [Fusarium graminearum]|nr:unnamed protein product [Fusarium graminearum]CAG1967011.1 unnamed protein product [Fusarium graminearum]CAG1969648.1 unnamed protein product [Fusarium graminearum]VTO86742.1 unnamed protein product [Fusarium graminearum]